MKWWYFALMHGCASIIGFQEFVGKTLKIAKVDRAMSDQ